MSAQLLMSQERLDERSLKTVARIQRSVDRAMRLIGDVLDFTQARLGGGLELNRAATDLAALADEAVEEIRVTMPGREIVFETTDAAQAVGEWDPGRLSQVVFNLVGNAVKFSGVGTPVVVIVRGGEHDVELAVHNDGPAIAPDLISHLFLPMRRAAGTALNAERSVGLGLYIVDHIVRLHGGSVDVSSTDQAGTTFCVQLPRTVV
jgi:signal transduction histidine kinase